MIEAISPVMSESVVTTADKVSEVPNFSNWLTQNVEGVNEKLVSAENGLAQLATGETSNLHHVMLELQSAKLEFQLVLQIRNKVLEGYQEIMRMQI